MMLDTLIDFAKKRFSTLTDNNSEIEDEINRSNTSQYCLEFTSNLHPNYAKTARIHITNSRARELFDNLILIATRTTDHGNSYAKHGRFAQRIQGILSKSENCMQILETLALLADKKVWTSEDVDFWKKKPCVSKNETGIFCANLLALLLDMTEIIDEPRAKVVLKMMADNLPNLSLRSWAYSHQYSKLAIITAIQKRIGSEENLSPDIRLNAGRLLALLLEQKRPNQLEPEPKDNPVLQALRELAGQAEKQDFFQRMLVAGSKREFRSFATDFTPEARALWCEAMIAAQSIVKDFENYRNGQSAAEWTTNPIAFDAALGKHEKDPTKITDFGWWIEDSSRPKTFLLTHSMLGKAGTDDFPKLAYMTAKRLNDICATSEIEENNQRFSASASNVIDIKLFQFSGKDNNGTLINLYAEADGSATGPKWKASARACIKNIEPDTVAEHIARWLKHFKRLECPPSDHNSLETVGWTLSTVKACLGPSGHFPVPGTPEYLQAAFRCAWRLLANDGQLLFDRGDKYRAREGCGPYQYNPELSDNNEIVACGVAHTLALLQPETSVPLLAQLLDNLLLEDEHRECRNKKVLSVCCSALGELGTPEAIALLGKVRRHITDKNLHKQIDKALANAGSKVSLSLDDMKDRAMASHSVDRDGRRVVEIDGWRVELSVETTRKAKLQTTAPNGKIIRGIAKAFSELTGGKEATKSLEESKEDIERILPEARKRLEGSYRNLRHWPLAFWQDHLAGNGLLHTIMSRLVWNFTNENGDGTTAMMRNNVLCNYDGKSVAMNGDGWTVTLWHPVKDTAENVAAWRRFIVSEKIRQPFLQAWRPVYVVTDAERRTSTYSNRFAAHVLEQAPAMAVLKAKGWNAVNRVVGGNNEKNERVRLALPAFGLVAEYWLAGVGNMLQPIPAGDRLQNHTSTMYAFVATDRLAFYQLEEKKHAGGQAVTIENVPALALSEAMLDIDNIVARTSIGNDKHWKDEGVNAKHPTSETIHLESYRNTYRSGQSAELAATRHAFLSEILPGLEIANCCTLQKDHLLVDGKHHSYKINLTSGGIHIAPNDRYLCIVPKTGSAKETLLPYEDDTVLSIIISKAMMLANEDQIDDPSIRSQLGIR
jgi:Domain of unknown function (DUF4132)